MTVRMINQGMVSYFAIFKDSTNSINPEHSQYTQL